MPRLSSARWLVLLLVVVIAIATVTTLRALPYPDRGPQAGSRVMVRATGAQWAWTIEGPDLVVGKPVEFQVTSTDVNHGFGIYNPAMEMVAQTQAMPGYVNRLQYTFTTAGTHRILCLEYCGHEISAPASIRVSWPISRSPVSYCC